MRDETQRVQRWETVGSAAAIFEAADREATEDPAAALPLAIDAVRATRAVGVVCLESRALAVLALVLLLLGRRRQSRAVFDAARAYGCRCCLPAIDRRRAYLVAVEEGPPRALEVAREALSMARRVAPGEVTLCHQTFGVMLYYNGDFSGAVRELTDVVDSLPHEAPYYGGVLLNLCTALIESEDLDDLRYAVRKLQEIPDRLKGKKRLTQVRAKLAWTTGQALGRLAVLDEELSAVKRRAMLKKAARQLRIACDGLRILQLPLEIAACHADLASVLARVDPLQVEDALTFDFSELSAAIVKACEDAQTAAKAVFSPEAMTALWAALRLLRDATVEAGAPPPVLIYARP